MGAKRAWEKLSERCKRPATPATVVVAAQSLSGSQQTRQRLRAACEFEPVDLSHAPETPEPAAGCEIRRTTGRPTRNSKLNYMNTNQSKYAPIRTKHNNK